MYSTKEIARAFNCGPNTIIAAKPQLKLGVDFYFTNNGIMWRESAVKYFKKKFSISNPTFLKIDMKQSCLANRPKKKEGLTKERKKNLNHRFSKLPDGSYMKSELKDFCRGIICGTVFNKIIDEYCNTFDPIVTKRGTNFYDKNVDLPSFKKRR